MQEDIKIVESLLEEGFSAMCPTEAEAIENLIKGYRELEEQLEIDKAYGLEKAELQKELGCKILKCKIVDKNINLNLKLIDLKKNSIPKSKIKEKIEEYKKKIEKRPYDKPIIEIYIRVLQELMEDK